MTDDTMAALRETLLDRLLRFTTRTDLSVTACVEGDIRPAGKARSESHPAARCAIAVPQHRRGGSGPEILDLEQALYTGKRGCERCHDLAEAPAGPGKSRHKVTAPGIVKQWMPASKFAHGPHRTTPCRECHDAAEHSTTAGDVLVPGIARCRECHGNGASAAR